MPDEEMQRRFERDWANSIAAVFGASPPASATWTDLEGIKSVLSKFAGKSKNHTHLPRGGGMDVVSVQTSPTEHGSLELDVGDKATFLVKPNKLEFTYIPESPHDSFLLLQLDKLAPTGIYENVDRMEELVELEPGDYVERGVWDDGYLGHDEDGREIPLPKTARLVIRWLEGKMLLVAKGSLWNGTPATYDGRHNTMSADEIRRMIVRGLR